MRCGGVVQQHGQAAERRISELNQLLGLQLVSDIRTEERSLSGTLFNETDGLAAAGFVRYTKRQRRSYRWRTEWPMAQWRGRNRILLNQ